MRDKLYVGVALVVLLGCVPIPTADPEVEPLIGSETAAAFAPPSAAGPATIVVNADGGNTAWVSSWSEDGVTWNTCDLTTCGYGEQMPTAPEQGVTGGITTFRGNPAVAAAADGSGVVMAANIADRVEPSTHAHALGLVVLMMSIDGGRNWIQTIAANPLGSGDGCDEGGQDQQDLSYDPDTNTFWVAWRHTGAATAGLCVRGFHVVAGTYEIVFQGPSHEVQHVDHPILRGVGGVRVRHTTGSHLTVVYSYSADLPCPGTTTMRWVANHSTDDGYTWEEHHPIYASDSFSGCFAAGTLTQGYRSFAFDRDRAGRLWVALTDTATSIRLYKSIDHGRVWFLDTIINSPGRTTTGQVALVGDLNGLMGLSFYRSTTQVTPTVSRWFAGRGVDVGAAWSLPVPIGAPITVPIVAGGRGLGDYQGITLVDPSSFPSAGATFFPVWTGRHVPPAGGGLAVRGALVSYGP